MNLVVKRVYEAASPSDGVRVLVDRLWPRGLTKQDAAAKFWLRDLAPSNELRQWFHANPEAWRMFRKRYLKELASAEGAAAVERGPRGEGSRTHSESEETVKTVFRRSLVNRSMVGRSMVRRAESSSSLPARERI